MNPPFHVAYAPPPPGSQRSGAVPVFVALNFVLAALSFVGVIGTFALIVYGVYYSGDTGEELAAGVFGSLMIGLPAMAGSVIYTLAGVGLMRRRPWGYYMHMVGAGLAVLSCVGVLYAIPAILFAVQSSFKDEFFPRPYPPPYAAPPYGYTGGGPPL